MVHMVSLPISTVSSTEIMATTVTATADIFKAPACSNSAASNKVWQLRRLGMEGQHRRNSATVCNPSGYASLWFENNPTGKRPIAGVTMSPYPKLFEPLDLGFTTASQSDSHGFNAHRDGRRQGLYSHQPLLRRACQRGRCADCDRWDITQSPRLKPFAAKISTTKEAKNTQITDAVHKHDSKICVQLLHAGRYAYHPLCVAPSRLKSPISMFKP